jgi:hypothetical protein
VTERESILGDCPMQPGIGITFIIMNSTYSTIQRGFGGSKYTSLITLQVQISNFPGLTTKGALSLTEVSSLLQCRDSSSNITLLSFLALGSRGNFIAVTVTIINFQRLSSDRTNQKRWSLDFLSKYRFYSIH